MEATGRARAPERIGQPVPGTTGWAAPDGRHWQAYSARCAECRRILYPTLTAPPTPDWRCALCRSGRRPSPARLAALGKARASKSYSRGTRLSGGPTLGATPEAVRA